MNFCHIWPCFLVSLGCMLAWKAVAVVPFYSAHSLGKHVKSISGLGFFNSNPDKPQASKFNREVTVTLMLLCINREVTV